MCVVCWNTLAIVIPINWFEFPLYESVISHIDCAVANATAAAADADADAVAEAADAAASVVLLPLPPTYFALFIAHHRIVS